MYKFFNANKLKIVDNAMMLMKNLTFISQPHIEGVASDVKDSTLSNQIYLVKFLSLTVDTSFIFTKK